MFEVGEIVRFHSPLNADETAARFKVVEMRGDRVLVEMISSFDWELKPTTVHLVADLTKE
jgi:hypothetical protein